MSYPSHWKVLFLTVLGFTALACITINVYFPEAAVRDLSEKIEDAVAREAAKIDDGADLPTTPANPADGATQDAGATDQGHGAQEEGGGTTFHAASTTASTTASLSSARHFAGRVVGFMLDMTASDVAAQNVAAPEITNPAIRKIVDSRAQRVAELNRFKASGALGENNQALVEIRDLESLALRERAAVQKLVRDENADRDRMFREIAAATDADLSQLGRIQSTYAETLRNNAGPGEWIQMPDGRWQKKG